ncbi:MAG: vesicle coat component [Chaenotheca gracillima]|nr:MAG: vesicle coat component [Chaenotheca gracillima]
MEENKDSFGEGVVTESNGDKPQTPPTGEASLPRPAADPFAFMGHSDRTNSFPEVPPAHDPSKLTFDHAPPSSQAEDVLERLDEDRSIANELVEGPDFRMSENKDKISSEDGTGRGSWDAPADVPEDDFFERVNGTQGAEPSSPPDAEARFEEGLPLVSQGEEVNESQIQFTEPGSNASRSRSESDEPTDAQQITTLSESFTDQEGRSLREPARDPQQGLERKSTSQVLEGIKFTPHAEAHQNTTTTPHNVVEFPEDVASAPFSASPKPSITEASEENIARDEPVELEWMEQAESSGEATAVQEITTGAHDQDLSAMWQAALDDDELLDDDTSAAENTVDPADYFGKDPTGFLQDDEQDGFDSQEVLQSTPFLPNRTPNDQIQARNHQPVNFNGAPGASSTVPASQQYGSASQVQHPGVLPSTQWSSTLPTLPSPYPAPGPHSYGQQQVPSTNTSFFQPTLQRPQPSTAESFADKSKGGYSSPYDLPLDVTRPRKRASMQQMAGATVVQKPPPPRSSSINLVQQSQEGHFPSNMSISHTPDAAAPPSHYFQPNPISNPTNPVEPTTSLKPKPSGFFEELPVTAKPRHATSTGRYTPQANQPSSSSPAPPQGPVVNRAGPQSGSLPLQSSFQAHQGPPNFPVPQPLLPAERVSPYATTLNDPPLATPPVVASSRYSPAPPPRSASSSGGQYAAAPKGGYSPVPNAPAHQPRNSSPLAHHERHAQGPAVTSSVPASGPSSQASVPQQYSQSGGYVRNTAGGLTQHTIQENPEYQHASPGANGQYLPQGLGRGLSEDITAQQNRPFPTSTASSSQVASRRAASPQYRTFSQDASTMPPKRSQTQSPGAAATGPRSLSIAENIYQRPASVNDPTSPISAASPYTSMVNGAPHAPSRSFSQNTDYVAPTDGRQADPLERWKGYPIFAWGFGGSIITSFPKDTQRYNAGSAFPVVKRSQGEIKMTSMKDVLPLDNHIAHFPGPLKTKSKKKEVITWLSGRIDEMEKILQQVQYAGASSELVRENEEKIFLWKSLRIFVDSDGAPEGNPEVGKAVREFLTPGAENESSSFQPPSLAPSSLSVQQDTVDPESVTQIRSALLRGERESAIWHAVDKRLWAHALLISSTVNRSIWKQVVQEFVRKEVKGFGSNTESLAALYEIFAGNWEESIDELVPPSARAGMQMVSKSSDPGQTKNALEGLDHWKETLSLILNNRSAEDGLAIQSLGKLLLEYGRVDAAHACFIFARLHAHFGGPDDPQSSMTLVGANHLQYGLNYLPDLDSVLLSEVYEFGVSLAASSTVSSATPHMQAYKLYHAFVLAEHGLRNDAQVYCEAIYTTIKSSTKASPYYHGALVGALDDLSKRLHQSPKDGASSWISKPSMEKVSGSFLAKFNSFVSGDDSDAASTGSGKDGALDVGPFARVAGDTPTISRSPSNTDLYSSYVPGEGLTQNHSTAPMAISKPSRYAPATSSYTPRSSLEHTRSGYDNARPTSSSQRKSQESDRSHDSFGGFKPQPSYPHANGGSNLQNSYEPFADQGQPQTFAEPSFQSDHFAPEGPPIAYQPNQGSPYVPTPPPEPSQPSQSYLTPQIGQNDQPASYNQPFETDPTFMPTGQSSYDPYGSSYEPSTSSYEPPSLQTYNPDGVQNEESSPLDTKPKKKSIMDDDDNEFETRAKAALTGKTEKDKQAEERFRKAAEADAARDDQLQGDKKGWFGGWFGGKKDPNATPGAIKAKLGEESSFYYDPDLKKWVNKKGGTTESTPTARPPPPKGPPSRSVSGGGPTSGPPSGRPPLPQQTSTGLTSSSMSSMPPPRSVSGSNLPGPSPLASGPSSTSLSSLDPTAMGLPPSGPASGTGTPARANSPLSMGADKAPAILANRAVSGGSSSGPPSRPSTSMSNASSIDDLLGPPGATRKPGGSVKKSKKGRGYVDVMAK